LHPGAINVSQRQQRTRSAPARAEPQRLTPSPQQLGNEEYIMSVLGSFTGSDQKGDLQNAKRQSDAALAQGYNTATGDYTQARGYFDPYAQTGNAANAMYANATGVNGQAAYNQAAQNFTTGDPFRQSNEDFANQQLLKTFNARGSAYGGNAMLAAARGSLERGSTDWNNWLNRLQGQSQQGFQTAGAQAGITTGMGNLATDYGNTQATNDINFGNAMASNRNTLTNNLLGVAGLGLKAFTPGFQGDTPIGNIGNAMGNGYKAVSRAFG
jgi:hypothetical protein